MTNVDLETPLPKEDPMGATLSVGSDAYPYTVLKIKEKYLWAQRDSFKMAEGGEYFGNQIWDCYRNLCAPVELYTLRKDNRWRKKGDSLKAGPLYVGFRRPRQDPSF